MKEFIFVDESGDTGIVSGSSSHYLVTSLHINEKEMHHLRRHLAAFRYHSESSNEFKDGRWSKRSVEHGDTGDRLIRSVVHMKNEGALLVSATWLHKDTYRANRGPHLSGAAGDSRKFRSYQIRRHLEHHVQIRPWGDETDLVIDRWQMTLSERDEFEKYIHGNWNLRPKPTITFVDSLTCDQIQVVDIVARMLYRKIAGTASEFEEELCHELVVEKQILGGIY